MLVKRKLGELRVNELRAELDKRNIDSKGLKGTLIQRLQKAITDEGGDINQIEIDVIHASSPGQKKNSPRVKKAADLLTSDVHTGDSSKTTSVVATPSETSNLASTTDAAAANTAEEIPNEAHDERRIKTDLPKPDGYTEDEKERKESEKEEVPGTEPPMTEDEGKFSTDGEDVTVPTQGSPRGEFTTTQNEDEATVESTEEASLEAAEDTDTLKTMPDPTDVASDTSEPPQFEAEELKSRSENAEGDTCEIPAQDDNQDSEVTEVIPPFPDETVKSEDADIAMEDDVLDMLDYDIEIPDHSTQTTANEGENITQQDSKDNESDVNKSSDEKDKNSTVKTESSKGSESKSNEKGLKNLWISGLSSSTRASELKVAFSRYGKVVGAKVVTNARSPGSKCYGFVAMATADAADKCILHLNKTEMHGKLITVEHTKHDPSASRKTQRSSSSKVPNDTASEKPEEQSTDSKNASNKDSSSRDGERTGRRASNTDPSKDPGSEGKPQPARASGEKAEPRRSTSDAGPRGRSEEGRPGERRMHRGDVDSTDRSRGTARPLRRPIRGDRRLPDEPFRKRPRPLDSRERKVVIDNQKGEMSLRVNVRSSQDAKGTTLRRVSRSPIRNVRPSRPEERVPRRVEGRQPTMAEAQARIRDREQRTRDAREDISRNRAVRGTLPSARPMAVQASIERERLLLRKEREERNFLRQEREKLERERRQLERDRLERERLEQERLRLEQERKRELEKLEREKEEMKRLQEINRYELSQRQRAIKRMYDDSRSDRMESKRIDRDDRRRFEPESRDRSGGGGSMDVLYRGNDVGYRPRGNMSGRMDTSKTSYHDVDRRDMSHNDTDARYSSGSRRVEKYDRSSDYGSDRRGGAGDSTGSASFRHHDRDNDDRKVITRDRGRVPATSASYRRDDISLSKKESGIREGPTGTRSRAPDRDLREEIRQAPLHGGGRKQVRDDAGSGRRSSPRSAPDAMKYSDRSHPEPNVHGNAPPGVSGGKPIPTTGRSGLANFQPSSTWPSWQHGGDRGDNNTMWHGANNIQGGAPPVGRMMAPMGVPFNAMPAMTPPQPMGGDGMIPHHISSTYMPPDRSNAFKPMRKF